MVTIYIKLPRLCACVSYGFLKKRADRFPSDVSWFIGVIGRRQRIKTSGKFRPLMCKNWENGAKWPILRKSARATSAGLRNGLRSARTPARWPTSARANRAWAWGVAFDAGPSQTLLCSWVQFSGPTSRPTFGVWPGKRWYHTLAR